MIGISYTPDTETLTVVGHTSDGTPLYLVCWKGSERPPTSFGLGMPRESEVTWWPFGNTGAWEHLLAMVKVQVLMQSELEGPALEMALRQDTMELLGSFDEVFHVVFSHEEMCEQMTGSRAVFKMTEPVVEC